MSDVNRDVSASRERSQLPVWLVTKQLIRYRLGLWLGNLGGMLVAMTMVNISAGSILLDTSSTNAEILKISHRYARVTHCRPRSIAIAD